jgi:hypothetical protein
MYWSTKDDDDTGGESFVKLRRGSGSAFAGVEVYSVAGGNLLSLADKGATGNSAVAWLQLDDSAGTRMGYLGYGSGSNGDLYMNNDIHGGDLRFVAENASGTAVTMLHLDPDGDVNLGADLNLSGGNYALEGYEGQRNILRTERIIVQPGATPGTNINVSAASADAAAFNNRGLTAATNLAKSGTSGSFELNAAGTVITITGGGVIGEVGCSLDLHDINSSSTTETYIGRAGVSSSEVVFSIYRTGTTSPSDYTSIMDAGDRLDIIICYTTNA